MEPRLERDAQGRVCRVWLSARSGRGLALLDQAFEECFAGGRIRRTVQVGPAEAALRAKLYRLGTVLRDDRNESGGWSLELEISPMEWRSLTEAGVISGEAYGTDAAA
jgi:GTP-binding protein HflX